jgi:nucleoside-diphosphate-sugar epimerase
MRILVTGSAGFVGTHLVPKLRKLGHYVIGTEHMETMIADCKASDFDAVIHLAANIENVDTRMKQGVTACSDILLDYQMCKWIQESPPTKAFVAMSSCAVDFPDDPYCIVKRTLEALCLFLHKRGVPVVILRPFSGYGKGQSLEYPFPAIKARAARKEDPLVVWGGSQVRDWLHINDLTDAIIHSIDNFPHGEPIEIGTGIPTSLYDLAVLLAKNAGYGPAIQCDLTKMASSPQRLANIDKAAKYGWMYKIDLAEGINL